MSRLLNSVGPLGRRIIAVMVARGSRCSWCGADHSPITWEGDAADPFLDLD